MKKTYEKPILVTGATGKQGGAVVRHLLANGHKVRVLTRSPDKDAAISLKDAGAEVVKADLEDKASLYEAFKGVDGLYSVQDFLEAGVDAEIRQGMNLIAALKESNIEHVVYTGASTMDRHTGVPHLDSKWKIEMAIRKAGKPWTVFRPAAFMDNWEWDRESIMETGVVSYPMHPDTPYAQIACDDIGRMVAQAFEEPEKWVNKAAPITGELSSMKEITSTIGKILNRDIQYKQICWDEIKENQGEELMLMYKSFDTYGMDGSPYFLKRWLGEISSFETYLRNAGWGK